MTSAYLAATAAIAPAGARPPWDRLVHDIRVAKVWNVVEYLGFVAPAEITQPPAAIAALLDGLCAMVAAALRS